MSNLLTAQFEDSIVDRRLRHSHGVGVKLFTLVNHKPTLCRTAAREMYVLGLLHDIGYQFAANSDEHAKFGGELLKKQGFKLWREVFWHGRVQREYDSPELRLLNYCDMIVGPNGEPMTMKQRIADLTFRYGGGSQEERDGIALARFFEDWNPETV